MSKGVPGVSAEFPVFKDALVLFIANFVEVIHVELPDEGGEVAVSEVDGKDLLFEAIDVDNGEVGSFVVPSDDL